MRLPPAPAHELALLLADLHALADEWEGPHTHADKAAGARAAAAQLRAVLAQHGYREPRPAPAPWRPRRA